MRKYKVLCLTDDAKHSQENSVYAILNGLLQHEKCDSVFVASRADPKNLTFFRDQVFDHLYAIKVTEGFSFDPTGNQFIKNAQKIKSRDFDIILLRLPRPITDEFLVALSDAFSDQCIINNPKGIIATSTKAFLLNFPEHCPPVKLCMSKNDVLDFVRTYDCVLKPLKEYGGKGIVRVINGFVSDGKEEYSLETYLERNEDILITEGMLAMKYLKNVKNGDKRLLVVNGEILAASLRLPSEDSWLCNVARGGTSMSSEPTAEEYAIVKDISRELTQRGILIYGADTLEDDTGKRILSEINTLSIGGFPQAQKQTGKPIIEMLTKKIFDYASEY